MRSYQLNEEEYLAAQKLHNGGKTTIYMLAITAVYSVILFLLIDPARAAAFSGIFAVVVLLLPPVVRNHRLRRVYYQQKSLQQPFTITFDDERLEWASESGNARIRWEDFLKYKENDRMFLLYESSNLIRIVPKNAFTDGAELKRFRERLAYVGTS